MKIVYIKFNIFYLKILLCCASLASIIFLCITYINLYHNINEQDIIIKKTLDICNKILNLPATHHSLNITGTPQRRNNSSFSVYYNYLEAIQKYDKNETITYATHITPEFIGKVKELAISWDGPISIAVFAPATDICLAIERILFLRNCDSDKIKARVTWHLYWSKHAVPFLNISEHVIENKIVCSVVPDFSLKTWRMINNYSYPINVGRNIARFGAKSYYVLPSDVELIPSPDLVSQFLKYVSDVKKDSFNTISLLKNVFVIPVFETKSIIPKNKEELTHQLLNGSAVYFHRYVCKHCQRFPKFEKWVKHQGYQNKIMAFSIVRRHFPYHRWEPIFIGTNNEPLYDEELTWEGLQDKMAQMHELCLLNYTFIILDGAFLVHLPGIKTRKDRSEPIGWGKVFLNSNSIRYNEILVELDAKYGRKKECRKH